MTNKLSHCKSCGAAIYWLKHVKTGKLAPIDAVSNMTGNIATYTNGTYRIIAGTDLSLYRAQGLLLNTNHFMTCPTASQHKKEKA